LRIHFLLYHYADTGFRYAFSTFGFFYKAFMKECLCIYQGEPQMLGRLTRAAYVLIW